MPAPRQSIFIGCMLFVMSNQQCQSTDGNIRLILDQKLTFDSP